MTIYPFLFTIPFDFITILLDTILLDFWLGGHSSFNVIGWPIDDWCFKSALGLRHFQPWISFFHLRGLWHLGRVWIRGASLKSSRGLWHLGRVWIRGASLKSSHENQKGRVQKLASNSLFHWCRQWGHIRCKFGHCLVPLVWAPRRQQSIGCRGSLNITWTQPCCNWWSLICIAWIFDCNQYRQRTLMWVGRKFDFSHCFLSHTATARAQPRRFY